MYHAITDYYCQQIGNRGNHSKLSLDSTIVSFQMTSNIIS